MAIPPDRLNMMFFVFLIHGIGVLIPWNSFITASRYFTHYKLENLTEGNYKSYFMQYLTFASQIPNVCFNWFNVFAPIGGSLTKRIIITIVCEIILMLFTILLAMINTSDMMILFFWLTMLTVVLLNGVNAIYQNTLFGVASTLPFKYIGAIILGNNVCGVFMALVSIITKYAFNSLKTAAIYYFLIATAVLFVCFDTFLALPLFKFYRFFEIVKIKQARKEAKKDTGPEPIPYFEVFKTAFIQLLNVFLIFFVTLAIFPTMQIGTQRSDPDFIIPQEWFLDVTCFLTFNFFAMLGSLTVNWVQWPGPKGLIIGTSLRLLFIPLFLLCNYQPMGTTRTLPVLFKNDWFYWLLAVLMAYTSGYFSALGMMYAPGTVPGKYAVTAGMFAAAMLITGIFVGILSTYIWPLIV